MIAPAGHHCNVRSGHLNATFGGKDMGSMAQTGLLLVPSDALGHTWALPGVLGAGKPLPPKWAPHGGLFRRLCVPAEAAATEAPVLLGLRRAAPPCAARCLAAPPPRAARRRAAPPPND